jgi:hypothetical protein
MKQHISFGTVGRCNVTKNVRPKVKDANGELRTKRPNSNKRVQHGAATTQTIVTAMKRTHGATDRKHARFLLHLARTAHKSADQTEVMGQVLIARGKMAAKVERKAYKAERENIDRIARIEAFLPK